MISFKTIYDIGNKTAFTITGIGLFELIGLIQLDILGAGKDIVIIVSGSISIIWLLMSIDHKKKMQKLDRDLIKKQIKKIDEETESIHIDNEKKAEICKLYGKTVIKNK